MNASVCVIFQFLIWGYCVDERKKEFIPFWNKAGASQNVEKVKWIEYLVDALYVAAQLRFNCILSFFFLLFLGETMRGQFVISI